MKKILALVVVAAAAVGAGWWFHVGHGFDRFDYEATFEQPGKQAATSLTDVVAIAGKDRDAVRHALGEPRDCEIGEFSERCQYNGIGIEITYIADKADWITVPLQSVEVPLTPDALALLGLPQREPDEVNEHEDIWRGLAGYREVRLVGADQGAIYARIKVSTL